MFNLANLEKKCVNIQTNVKNVKEYNILERNLNKYVAVLTYFLGEQKIPHTGDTESLTDRQTDTRTDRRTN